MAETIPLSTFKDDKIIVIVHTGYTSRLIEDFKSQLDKMGCVYICDTVWGSEDEYILKEYILKEDPNLSLIKKFHKENKLDGTATFICTFKEGFEKYRDMKSCDYCADFGICNFEVHQKDNQVIVVIEADTESG